MAPRAHSTAVALAWRPAPRQSCAALGCLSAGRMNALHFDRADDVEAYSRNAPSARGRPPSHAEGHLVARPLAKRYLAEHWVSAHLERQHQLIALALDREKISRYHAWRPHGRRVRFRPGTVHGGAVGTGRGRRSEIGARRYSVFYHLSGRLTGPPLTIPLQDTTGCGLDTTDTGNGSGWNSLGS